MAKCSADEAQSKKSIQDFFDKLEHSPAIQAGECLLFEFDRFSEGKDRDRLAAEQRVGDAVRTDPDLDAP